MSSWPTSATVILCKYNFVRLLEHARLTAISMCTCVCWTWRKSLTSPENRPLWRTMELAGKITKGWRSPGQQVILKYLANSGNDIRRLTIASMKRYYINNAKLQAIFRAARNLEYLDMREQMEKINFSPQAWPKNIVHLRLTDVDAEPEIIDAVAGSVVNLDLNSTALPSRMSRRPYPILMVRPHQKQLEWSNLRFLRISVGYRFISLIGLPPLMPNLEQLWIRDFGVDGNQYNEYVTKSDPQVGLDIQTRWAGKLKVLVYASRESELHVEYLNGLIRTLCVNHGDTLQYVDIAARWEDPSQLTVIGESFSEDEIVDLVDGRQVMPRPRDLNTFASLRSLRLERTVLDGEGARRALQMPLDSGKLGHFDIVFRKPGYRETEGPASVKRLRDFAWLQGAESIRSLGVHNFRFTRHPRDDNDLPLKGFLATFPRLEELEATSDYYEQQEFCTLLGDIILATNLKRIYQSVVTGAWLDKLRIAAAENGVEVIFGPRPREWPVQLA
jgi:F-box/TPR repeat protein Pof3